MSINTSLIDNEEVIAIIRKCNSINNGETGINSCNDNINDVDEIQIKYHRVSPKFKLLGIDVNIHLVHFKLSEEGKHCSYSWF